MPINTNSSKKHSKKRVVYSAILVVAVLLIGGFLWHRHNQHKSAPLVTTQTGAATPSPDVPTSQPANDNPTTGSLPNSKDNFNNQPGRQLSSNITPKAPLGNFVSNHHASLVGSPGPIENSTCETTPGAMCQIRFKSGNITKTLPVQKTNANGGTSWDWKLQDINLTAGTWQVTAIATNGDKSASATDALQLVIQQ